MRSLRFLATTVAVVSMLGTVHAEKPRRKRGKAAAAKKAAAKEAAAKEAAAKEAAAEEAAAEEAAAEEAAAEEAAAEEAAAEEAAAEEEAAAADAAKDKGEGEDEEEDDGETYEDAPVIWVYGSARLDVIFDDSRLSDVQSPFWVESEGNETSKNDSELSLHPRLTTFGLRIDPENVGRGFQADARIEVDFQNGGSDSRARLRMLQGYLNLSSGPLEILAGQTWDLVSPLRPSVNDDTMMWHAGNTGDRRPQLRLTLAPQIGDGKLRLAAAAGAPNAVNNNDIDGDGDLDGVDAATPTVQLLGELKWPHLTLGGWLHGAREQVSGATLTPVLMGGHVRVGTDDYWLQGEGFYGQNATDLRAGIGQGANALNEEIRTMGGWAEIGASLGDSYTLVAGATAEKPKEEDLDEGMRKQNMAAFLVQRLSLMEGVTVGLEYILWQTEYVNQPKGVANRFDLYGTFEF